MTEYFTNLMIFNMVIFPVVVSIVWCVCSGLQILWRNSFARVMMRRLVGCRFHPSWIVSMKTRSRIRVDSLITWCVLVANICGERRERERERREREKALSRSSLTTLYHSLLPSLLASFLSSFLPSFLLTSIRRSRSSRSAPTAFLS